MSILKYSLARSNNNIELFEAFSGRGWETGSYIALL